MFLLSKWKPYINVIIFTTIHREGLARCWYSHFSCRITLKGLSLVSSTMHFKPVDSRNVCCWETFVWWIVASSCFGLGLDDSMYFSLWALTSWTKTCNTYYSSRFWTVIMIQFLWIWKTRNLQGFVVWSLRNITVPWLGHELLLFPPRLKLQYKDTKILIRSSPSDESQPSELESDLRVTQISVFLLNMFCV